MIKNLIFQIEQVIFEINAMEETADSIIENIAKLEEISMDEVCEFEEVKEILYTAGYYYDKYDEIIERYNNWATIKEPEEYLRNIFSELFDIGSQLSECLVDLKKYSRISAYENAIISCQDDVIKASVCKRSDRLPLLVEAFLRGTYIIKVKY